MRINPVFRNIRANMPYLTRSEAEIARYILNNEARIGLETGASLAAATRVSEITVSRFLHKLGYRGIRDLKEQLKTRIPQTRVDSTERFMRLLSKNDSVILEAESNAILKLSSQLAREEWKSMVSCVHQSERVFVTGFQTVRGMSEDFAHRLGIVRDAVRHFSVHDGGLVEWVIPASSIQDTKNVLVLIDIQPYARESEKICQIARRLGFQIVVFTDEFNNWAYGYTQYIFHTDSKTGLFLETTAALNSILNFVLHAVAEREPERSRARIDNWLEITRELSLFK